MPSDAAFREAVEAYVEASDDRKWFGSDIHTAPLEVLDTRKDAALARLLALYAERQGEVYVVVDSDWHLGPIVTLTGEYKPGDRVRVAKVEEGR